MSESVLAESIPVLRRNLGITGIEAKAILPVILGGNMTPGGVAVATGEPLDKVERALGRLEKKGLVTRIDGIVPIFRISSTIFALEDILSSARESLSSQFEASKMSFDGHLTKVDESIVTVLESYKNTMDDGKVAFQAYETKMLEAVQSQVDVITSISTNILAHFTQSIEDSLRGLDTSVDDGLGERLSALHKELDDGQKALSSTAKKIAAEFEKLVAAEKKTSSSGMKAIEKKTIDLIETLRASVSQALTDSRTAFKTAGIDLSAEILTKTNEASDDAIASIGEATRILDDTILQMDTKLEAAYLATEDSLKEISAKSRARIVEEADAARTRIEEALSVCDTAKSSIASWKEEVGTFTEVATQSLMLQLDRVSATESDYLDNVRSAVAGNLEKTQAQIAQEYETLKDMSIEGITQFESHLNSCRASTLDLLRKQIKSQATKLETANGEMQKSVDAWSKGAIRGIDDKLTKISNEVGGILDTEASEVEALVETIDSRLKSAFSTAVSTSSTKHQSALTSIKKATHDFEAGLGTHLSALVSGYVNTTRSQIQGAKSLYKNLNEKLDSRLAQSVSSLTSQANRVQREVDKSLETQIERIDQHAQGIKEELHVHMEDMIRQFTNLMMGLEATFNGFLSGQTTEARDLISSTHTEFKGALKQEMATLQEDSQMMQQEFSTELDGRVDELVGTADAVKKALEELSVEKRTEISESMASVLNRIENAVRDTEAALGEIESGTIKQFSDSLIQVSKEFNTTVTGARDSIAERVDSIKDVTQEDITKSISNIRANIDAYTESQQNSGEKLLANTSKKMDTLASRLIRASNSNVEAFQTSLSEKETLRLEKARGVREEALSTIEERRSEVAKVFSSAAEALETSSGNLYSSLEILANKLDSEMTSLKGKLTKAADTTATKVTERGNNNLKDLEAISRGLIKNIESNFKEQSTAFGEEAIDVLTKAGEALANLPGTLAEIVQKSTKNTGGKLDEYKEASEESITEALSEFTDASKSASDESILLIGGVLGQATKTLNDALEETQQSATTSNQQAAYRLESIGLDLKSFLGGESARLVERLQNEVTTKNSEIAGAATKAMNDANEGISFLRQTRNDAFSGLSGHVDKLIRQWSAEQKKDLGTLRGEIEASVSAITSLAEQTVDTIEAVKRAGEEMSLISSDNTWYLTGRNEILAHMMDMVNRAEESVIISVVNTEGLDLKKLSKVKTPRRRVLVVPESEEPDSELSSLEGWRVWYTNTPTTLAIIDQTEILVGGSEQTETHLALISRDASYLRLYHDYLGPRLTQGRRTSTTA